MMKKLRKITFIVILSALFCALCFAPKNVAKADTCEHISDGVVIVSAMPSLTSSGLKQETCSLCGEPVNVSSLPSLSVSDWNMGEITLPTFKDKGNIVYTLIEDENIVVNFELPTLGDSVYDLEVLTEPTLTSAGQVSFKHTSDKLVGVVNGTAELEILTDTSKWAKLVTTEATCASVGQATYTYILHTPLTFTAEIPIKEHSYEWVFETTPTTENGGVARHMCKNAPTSSPHYDISLNLPSIPTERVSDENYDFEVVTKPTLFGSGVGKFVYKDSETSQRYEKLFVTVEIPMLVLKSFYVEEGKLYIEYTDGSSECLGTVQGEKGDKGDQGEKGDKGETGEKGDKGDQGLTGATGQAGQAGATGSAGEKGEKGDKGDQGLKGADGADGENGKSYTGLVATSITVSIVSLIMAGAMLGILLKKKMLF